MKLDPLHEHPLLSAARQRAWDLQSRLVWAPGLANGAAMVAVAGVIGNVQHPDTALDALWPGLAFFALGLVLSGASALSLVHFSRQLAGRAALLDKIGQLQTAGDSLHDDILQQIQTLQVAARDRPDEFSSRLTRILTSIAAHKEALPQALEIQRRVQDLPGKEPKTDALADWFSLAGLACCALGFSVVIGGHVLGLTHLEPRAMPTVQPEPKPAAPAQTDKRASRP